MLGGQNVGATVRRMMSKVGTNKLWSQYSLKGKRQKLALHHLAIYKVLLSKLFLSSFSITYFPFVQCEKTKILCTVVHIYKSLYPCYATLILKNKLCNTLSWQPPMLCNQILKFVAFYYVPPYGHRTYMFKSSTICLIY